MQREGAKHGRRHVAQAAKPAGPGETGKRRPAAPRRAGSVRVAHISPEQPRGHGNDERAVLCFRGRVKPLPAPPPEKRMRVDVAARGVAKKLKHDQPRQCANEHGQPGQNAIHARIHFHRCPRHSRKPHPFATFPTGTSEAFGITAAMQTDTICPCGWVQTGVIEEGSYGEAVAY
jgi:hypothetical protein